MDFLITKISNRFGNNKLLTAIYASNILLSFHYYLLVYINSSFLDKFWNESQISIIYIVASILNLLLLVNVSKILNRIGNYRLLIYALFFEVFSILGIALGTSPTLIVLYFIIHHVIISIIVFSLDVFLENISTDDSSTGRVRGMYMTLGNITLVIAPLILSFLVTDGEYSIVYLTSLLFLIPFYILVRKSFKNFKHLPVSHFKLRETIATYLGNKNIFDVFIANLTIQFFYSFMVIYTPIYLFKFIGFSWGEIGVMFTIMLLPFVIFEVPIGRLADKKYGEKEIMTLGFLIAGLATICISFLSIKSFLPWAIVLFLTRTGASFVDITTESYFFKQVKAENTDLISFYRIARPISFIIAPIFITIILVLVPFKLSFLLVGSMVIIFGAKYSFALVDTK